MKKIALMLQFWTGELEHVEGLIRLMVRIELLKPTPRDRLLILAIRHDVTDDDAGRMAAIASEAFITKIIRSKRQGTGWPAGCNDLWQSCLHQVAKIHAKLAADGILTFEADCCPMRADWLEVLDSEWNKRPAGKLCVGTIVSPKDDKQIHLNGNAIFQADIIQRHPPLCLSPGSWDFHHRRLLLTLAVDTFAIEQRYAFSGPFTPDDALSLRRHGQIPAMLHGVKTSAARDSVNEMLDSGSFQQTTNAPKP